MDNNDVPRSPSRRAFLSTTAATAVIAPLVSQGGAARADAYGLFAEHYEQSEVIWNGKNGEDIFFQNEMPYDPPSQAAWMQNSTTNGYPAFQITHQAAGFQGYGMGSYSFFNQGVEIFATRAFEVDNTPGVQLHHLLTIFLNANGGFGGIEHVVNDVGGSSTAANPDTPVDVVSYP